MDYQRPQRVSVLDPIEPAIERVRLMLFRPFDISKWFTIGFCAWLAYLGGGGSGAGSSSHNGRHPLGPGGPEMTAVRDAVIMHLPLLIIGAIITIPVVITILLLFNWLRSRGQFMLVHCVAGNVAEVAVPWKKFSRHGNSLFIFKIVLLLISIPLIIIPVILAVIACITISQLCLTLAGIAGVIAAGFVIFWVVVAILLVVKFTDDFVVPIMFLQTSSVLAGWRTFLTLLGVNKARMLLYVLFQIMLSIIIGLIIFIIFIVGCCCCCASILLLVPYIGTVILLPLIAFKRAYSLFYFSQFGTQFDVFGKPV